MALSISPLTPAFKLGASDDLLIDLIHANRILAHYKVLDTFGHVSVRCGTLAHPVTGTPTECFVQATYRAPALVTGDDLCVFSVETGDPLDPSETRKGALERHIHAGVYRKRPDAAAVLHCHAEELVTWSIVKPSSLAERLRPIFHVASGIGPRVPIFEIRDHHQGPSNLLVDTPALGDALAEMTLPNVNLVLMRGHGATLVSSESVRDVVSMGIYAAQNARIQRNALTLSLALGGDGIEPLGEEEIGVMDANVRGVARSWPLWVHELGSI